VYMLFNVAVVFVQVDKIEEKMALNSWEGIPGRLRPSRTRPRGKSNKSLQKGGGGVPLQRPAAEQ